MFCPLLLTPGAGPTLPWFWTIADPEGDSHSLMGNLPPASQGRDLDYTARASVGEACSRARLFTVRVCLSVLRACRGACLGPARGAPGELGPCLSPGLSSCGAERLYPWVRPQGAPGTGVPSLAPPRAEERLGRCFWVTALISPPPAPYPRGPALRMGSRWFVLHTQLLPW